MTMRSKVWLFVVVAIGLVLLMGVELYRGTRRGVLSRQHLSLIQDQIDLYSQMHNSTWPFVDALRHAQRDGADIPRILREQDARMDQDFARIESLELQETQLSMLEDSVALWEQSHERLALIHDAQHRWVKQAQELALRAERGETVPPDAWWNLFQGFEGQVGEQLEAAIVAERAEMEELRRSWDERSLFANRLAQLIPPLALVLVLGIALAILDPMQRSLRELIAGAERIGHGDFEHDLPEKGGDELATLARAFNRMAAELRELLREKQRYNTLLEDTVHTRTAELASTNARLEESLQRLQETQQQLLFADRLATMGRLTAGVGHEINNPLAFILSNLRYIQEELERNGSTPSDEERQELLSAVTEAYEGAERVRLIVQDLKVLSRQDDAAQGSVELVSVVRSAAKMAAHEIRPRARFVEDCEGVPPVLGNGARLGQVLLNLIINAAHAIEPGHVEQNEIRVVARESAPGLVTIEVRDTGCGIPPENLSRIFEPFFTTKPVGVGTGLGLSVCRNIIAALSGELTVESEPGKGTTFRITLPVAEDLEAPGRAA
ncbi:sensor histidine kinase [Vitiosangium sp. GDMCC 1.1324]|uniref:sensor histidine kinase n=1 Tax=Vitiosangium sp. (strain GDMCC 1.1324) TaxID=2138576 RepID=UPI000D36D2EF|nr:ATP-binding protein [Vitiosangium sp. GDMCC 1.1324]PTL82110.1 histidine kinase [Vitiosangium sp. GDMCC 1.1324]